MNEIIQEGKSREEAIAAALEKLGVGEGEVDIEDMEGPRDRFFGLLTSKTVRIKVRKKDNGNAPEPPAGGRDNDRYGDDDEEYAPVPREAQAELEPGSHEAIVKEFIDELIVKMGVELNAWVSRDGDDILVDLDGDDAGMLIGKFGQTLDSLQYISNVMLGKHTRDNIKVCVNVGDYRDRREESLRRMAKSMAGKVLKSHKEIVLAPMSPQDRRIIHMALSDYRNITTSSEGVGQNRRVVIDYKR